jgi:hypothetical protein
LVCLLLDRGTTGPGVEGPSQAEHAGRGRVGCRPRDVARALGGLIIIDLRTRRETSGSMRSSNGPGSAIPRLYDLLPAVLLNADRGGSAPVARHPLWLQPLSFVSQPESRPSPVSCLVEPLDDEDGAADDSLAFDARQRSEPSHCSARPAYPTTDGDLVSSRSRLSQTDRRVARRRHPASS